MPFALYPVDADIGIFTVLIIFHDVHYFAIRDLKAQNRLVSLV